MKNFKQLISIFTIGLITLMLTSCVSQKKYQAVVQENEDHKAQIAQLHKQLNNWEVRTKMVSVRINKSLESDYRDLAERNEQLGKMFRQLKSRMDNRNDQLEASARQLYMDLKGMDQTLIDIDLDRDKGHIKVSLEENLLFDLGKAKVKPEGKQFLDALASNLALNPEIRLHVVGHTDTIPVVSSKFDDNWDLSMERATEVIRLLKEEHQIRPERLLASGKGDTDPIATNETPIGRQLNRRVELILIPDLEEVEVVSAY